MVINHALINPVQSGITWIPHVRNDKNTFQRLIYLFKLFSDSLLENIILVGVNCWNQMNLLLSQNCYFYKMVVTDQRKNKDGFQTDAGPWCWPMMLAHLLLGTMNGGWRHIILSLNQATLTDITRLKNQLQLHLWLF